MDNLLNPESDKARLVETCFDAARTLKGDERRAYLDHVCGTNAGLRRQLEKLLSALGETDDFLERPVVEPSGTTTRVGMSQLHEGPGTVIGRYKILEQIGEGG